MIWWKFFAHHQATLVVREALLLGAFYLAYREVNTFCRWIYRYEDHVHALPFSTAPSYQVEQQCDENVMMMMTYSLARLSEYRV
jgi:hypothetical protein